VGGSIGHGILLLAFAWTFAWYAKRVQNNSEGRGERADRGSYRAEPRFTSLSASSFKFLVRPVRGLRKRQEHAPSSFEPPASTV
jgi:hypothetical protein